MKRVILNSKSYLFRLYIFLFYPIKPIKLLQELKLTRLLIRLENTKPHACIKARTIYSASVSSLFPPFSTRTEQIIGHVNQINGVWTHLEENFKKKTNFDPKIDHFRQ